MPVTTKQRKKLKTYIRIVGVDGEKIVGCNVDGLIKHIESKFEEGMTWENWSFDGWHIDHVIPISLFDLTKPKEQKKAIHYTNLQPMWGNENLKKNNKVEGEINEITKICTK